MSWLSDQWDKTKKNLSKYNNRKFKAAVMAICARVARADGTIQEEEKVAVGEVISGLPELKAFDPAELYTIFEKYCALPNAIFKAQCDRDIAGIKNDPAAAAAALQVGLAVANADGKFEPSEKQAVKEVCTVLGIDPAPYIA